VLGGELLSGSVDGSDDGLRKRGSSVSNSKRENKGKRKKRTSSFAATTSSTFAGSSTFLASATTGSSTLTASETGVASSLLSSTGVSIFGASVVDSAGVDASATGAAAAEEVEVAGTTSFSFFSFLGEERNWPILAERRRASLGFDLGVVSSVLACARHVARSAPVA
jgi:hypothetical protein